MHRAPCNGRRNGQAGGTAEGLEALEITGGAEGGREALMGAGGVEGPAVAEPSAAGAGGGRSRRLRLPIWTANWLV